VGGGHTDARELFELLVQTAVAHWAVEQVLFRKSILYRYLRLPHPTTLS
jgi:hypothetical protein